MKNGIFAVINVGASALRMQISEFVNHECIVLEYLIKPLKLGRDTFSKGYITLENVHKAAEILNNFSDKLKEYDIKNNYRAICTSSVRDAENRYFFIDHMRIKTGIQLEIIGEMEELFIKSLGVKNDISYFSDMAKEGILFVNLASGNIGINLIKKDLSLFSAALPFGTLRNTELFKNVNENLKYRAYEEYINKMKHHLEISVKEISTIKHMVGSGSSINLLLEIFKPAKFSIKRKKLENLYNEVKNLTSTEIAEKLNINEYYAEILRPTLYVYIVMLKIIGSNILHFSKQSFPHQLTLYYSKSIKEKRLNQKLKKNLIRYAKHYGFDEKHSNLIVKFSKTLFNSLKSIHSLGNKEGIVLESAALLHDVGYFVGINNHHEHSYYITRSFKMPGFDEETIDLIALITLFHRDKYHFMYDSRFTSLPIEKNLLLRKLIALLKIADSLDASHMQIIKDIEVEIKESEVLIIAKALKKPFFEELTFYKKKTDFQEIYGIPANLKVDLTYED